MKNILLLFLTLSLFNCNPNDCFESTGKTIQKEIVLPIFNKIEVGNEISLLLKQGNSQKVIIKSGENIIENVSAEVIDGKLIVEEENICNLNRDYAVTTLIITSPNIIEIRSNTARNIKSEGVLTYSNLFLVSEDFNTNALNIGDFNLNINCQNLTVSCNGSSIVTIKGTTENLNVGFYAGSTRFIGNDLIANNVTIIQKSSNDILVNPQNSITGNIHSVGDVLSFNRPNIVSVTEHYTGKLIFK